MLVLDEHPVAARLELRGRGFHVVDIEFAPGMRRRNVVRPGRVAEAGLRGLRERPEGEGLGTVQPLGMEISALFFLESDAESVAVQPPTHRDVTNDGTEAC